MNNLNKYILDYIRDMKTEQGVNTVCNRLSVQLKERQSTIRGALDFLEYENKIVYVKVKHNGKIYLTPKLYQSNGDIISTLLKK